MSPVWGHVAGVMIVLMMLTFIGIWIWAWLPYHKRAFNRLSRLPMEDDVLPTDHPIPVTRPEDRA
ncbi:MAG: cbb3-type cytochrome c oxidase subunit 3 [Proteobacteria bacterium]|nr:cbb3-type cytochrome c oxidase subunit 3 [Pseudomonadota bacterium]